MSGVRSHPAVAAFTYCAGIRVTSTDPVAYAVVAVVLAAVAALACWMPARRATRADPIDALRQE
jgi:ABC-type antimicrobial peptide transport system permease subunit